MICPEILNTKKEFFKANKISRIKTTKIVNFCKMPVRVSEGANQRPAFFFEKLSDFFLESVFHFYRF